ncbi:MAG: hypothetical protein EP343_23020 [Deltaproteobacteria bacterium]|nr:MAG: hypothetical protein EP343_23020 [Deltaproteobacteria bacterium]
MRNCRRFLFLLLGLGLFLGLDFSPAEARQRLRFSSASRLEPVKVSVRVDFRQFLRRKRAQRQYVLSLWIRDGRTWRMMRQTVMRSASANVLLPRPRRCRVGAIHLLAQVGVRKGNLWWNKRTRRFTRRYSSVLEAKAYYPCRGQRGVVQLNHRSYLNLQPQPKVRRKRKPRRGLQRARRGLHRRTRPMIRRASPRQAGRRLGHSFRKGAVRKASPLGRTQKVERRLGHSWKKGKALRRAAPARTQKVERRLGHSWKKGKSLEKAAPKGTAQGGRRLGHSWKKGKSLEKAAPKGTTQGGRRLGHSWKKGKDGKAVLRKGAVKGKAKLNKGVVKGKVKGKKSLETSSKK